MNKHLYRIVFNKRRGQMMVVAENAGSCGKAASGEGEAWGAFGGGSFGLMAAALRPMCVAVSAALGMVLVAAGPAYAQVKADPNAPGTQQATVLQTSNGTVQVNIQTPSAGGVSRNTFSQFDITAYGAVLNNSRSNVQSQIGGWVQGNPWLQGGSARVILNEVNSSNPSQLRGYVEVAGQRAEVIIANPSGVQVDGGGFINASRVTLTTGTPQFGNGNLDSYLIQRGTVSINGLGLDVSQTDFTTILARALQLNAGIWAKELRVVAGTNQIEASAGGAVTQAAASGGAPVFALDVAYLGGMYAGKITLIGTEAGLGVRNAGVLAASSGNLVLDANGWLSNSGSVQATGQDANASIKTAGDITNTGTVYAAGDTNVTSGGAIAGAGMIAAKNNTTLEAARIAAGAGAVIASGMNTDGSLGASGDLRITAGTGAALHGTAAAGGKIDITGAQLDLSGARLFGEQAALTATSGDLNASRAILSTQGAMALNAAAMLRTDAAQVTAGQLVIGAHDLSNVGGQLSQFGTGDLALALPGTLDNTFGQIASNSANLTLSAKSLFNTDGAIAHAGTGALVIGATTLSGQGGQISGNGSLAVTATNIDHRGAAVSARSVVLNAATLDNSAGRIESLGDASIDAATVRNTDGRITAAGAATVTAVTLDNTGGAIAAGSALSVTSATITNAGGSLQALGGAATLRATDLNNASGSVYARGNLDTVAVNAGNSGSMYAGGDMNLAVSGALANSGVIAAQGNATINAESISAGAGSLLGAGVKADGAMALTGDLNVTAVNGLALHGQNIAAGSAALSGTSVDVSGSQTTADDITLKANSGNVTTADALVASSGALAVDAGQALINTGGTLSAGQFALAAAHLDNTRGTIIQTGAGNTVLSLDGTLNNTAGRMSVNSANLALNANTLLNTDGTIEHAGSGALTITAASLSGARGAIIGNGSLNIAAGAVNHDGASTSARSVELTASDLSNRTGVIAAANALTVSTQALDNTGGAIQASSGALNITTEKLLNGQGKLSAGTNLAASTGGALQNDGVLYAGGDQELSVGGIFTNVGSVAARGNVSIAAGSILSGAGSLLGAGINADGSFAPSGNLTLSAVDVLLANGSILAAGDAVLGGASVNLDGSQASARNIAITAGSGSVSTAKASIGTAGTLSVAAAQALDNREGRLTAGQLSLNAADLNNNGGAIIQTGAGDTAIDLAGTLDNSAGQIIVNSANLAIGAASLKNTDGAITYAGAGALAITATNLDGARGSITGNGSVRIDVGAFNHNGATTFGKNLVVQSASIDNRGGHLLQGGAGTIALDVSGQLNNAGGEIAGNGDLAVNAGMLDNVQGRISSAASAGVTIQGALNNTAGELAAARALAVSAQAIDNTIGDIQSSGAALTVNAGSLANGQGTLSAGTDLTIATSGDLLNAGVMYAGRDQSVTVGGALNSTGSIASQRNTTIAADSVNAGAAGLLGAGVDADGSLAQAGKLTVNAVGALQAAGNVLAKGDLVLTGASVDLGGSQAGAANVAVNATSGNVTTSLTQIGTAGTLSITAAQAIDNHAGSLNAGQIALSAASLNNDHGTIVQSGAGDTGIGIGGTLDNTFGHIAVNSASLTLAAATLLNTDGKIEHAGAGTLAIGATYLDGQRGAITSNGDLAVTAGDIDHRNAATAAQRIAIAAANLDNSGGRISQLGTGAASISASDYLDNSAGAIEGNGDLAVTAATLDNSAGRIAAVANAGIHAGTSLDNSAGFIAGGAHLSVSGGNVANTLGTLQAQAGNATLNIANLDNTGGIIYASDSLVTTAANVVNSGSMYAGGGQNLAVSGALTNTGTIASRSDTTISANMLTSDTSSLLAAGLNAGGALGQSGNLSVTAAQALIAAGQNLAAGSATLTGGSVDIGGSQTRADAINLNASVGNVNTSAATVVTAGDLSVAASQSLVNAGGTLSAGQLVAQVAALDNTAGSIIQTGAGSTSLSMAGTLNNTDGHISVNSGNLTLGAGTLVNTDGTIEHAGAGTLAIDAATLNGARGTIVGNGGVNIAAGAFNHDGASTSGQNVTVQASSLSNAAGRLLQSGAGNMRLTVAGLLDNSGGEVGSNGALNVQAASLDNSAGRMTAAGSAALAVQGALNNADGVIAAAHALGVSAQAVNNIRGEIQAQAGALTLTAANLVNTGGTLSSGTDMTTSAAGDLLNDGTLYAGGDQTVSVVGTFTNIGSVAAQGNTTVSAGALLSGADSLLGAGVKGDGSLAQSGNLTVTAVNGLQAGGTNLAAGNAVLSGGSVDLGGSDTSAANIAITAGSGNVNTALTRIVTAGTLAISTAQTLDNHQGTLSARQLTLGAANLNNSAGAIIQTGAGDTGIAMSGTLDNTAGRIAVNSNNLALNAGTLVNTDGAIEHAGAGVLAINAATLSGQRGEITANGALTINAGAIDHRDAVTAAKNVAIAAASLDNANGQITSTGAGSASIAVGGSLDNSGGAIESNGDVAVAAGTLDNSGGRIASTGNVGVNAGAFLNNTGGFIAGGASLSVAGGSVDNTGGNLQALAGNATLNIVDLNNATGNVYAGANLSTSAVNVANSGSMYAAGSHTLAASGSLTNNGVIAGQGDTTISANSIASGANSLLAAGLNADGVLGQTGKLSVTATNGLQANGQNLAAGIASLTGATVNLDASHTSADSIILNASAGDVTTSGATVATTGLLSIAASQSLVNVNGAVSAGQLVAQVAGLDNTHGALVQTGANDTVLSVAGTLNNTLGVIAVNSANLALDAGTLVNTDGAIEHAGAGTLAISAATLNGESGAIIGNGSLAINAGAFDHDSGTTAAKSVTVQAASLSNRGGELLQGGAGAMTLNVSGQLDNTSGDIGGNGILALQAGSLDNSAGSITAADSASVAIGGALTNTDGIISAAHTLAVSSQALDNTRGAIQAGVGALTLSASSMTNSLGTISAGTDLSASTTGDLLNNGVLFAGRDQALNVAGTFTNLGSAAAQRNMTVSAGSVAGGAASLLGAGILTDGSLAQTGDLVVNAANTMQAGGTNLAAGNATLTGASVNLAGSQTGADNISINATGGAVNTSLAQIGTPGVLSISATEALDNQQGALSAGQLSLAAANLNNAGGSIVHSGTAHASIVVGGTLDNTAGRIGVNGANLTLGAATLVNTDGDIEHAGSGTLAINAATLSGVRGAITGNGSLAITAGNVDLRAASTAAQRVTIAATNLNNSGGQIVQLGGGNGSIAVSNVLTNRSGAIDSYGSTAVAAASLDNSAGRIAAVGALGVTAGVLDNSAGFVAGGTSLNVSGGNVNNTSGALQAQAGSATLSVADLNNNAGSVFASGDLNAMASSLTNGGSIYAGGSQSLGVSGVLVNTGSIASLGNTTISADSVSSGANSLLAAGMNLNGSMAQTGNLSVTATQTLAANGHNIAAGNATLTGASVNLGASQTSAGNITLNATGGNVTTVDATVATAGTLSVSAADALLNNRGLLSAGQLVTQVANLDNTQGTIVQTGTGNTIIGVNGTLNNTAGRIAVNSANLTLSAPALINVGGAIEHAGGGTLTINATSFSGAGGQITANGSLIISATTIVHTNASTIAQQIAIAAASLDNRQGDIIQLGGGATMIGVGTLDNGEGVIASNGATTVSTDALNNQGGVLQVAGAASLSVSAAGTLDNSHGGLIASGGNTTLSGNVILNQQGEVRAAGTLSAAALQGIHNVNGLLVANGNIALAGVVLDNTGGQVASVQGNVNVTTSGATGNDSGVIQAGGDIVVDVRGLSNTQAVGYNRAGAIIGNNVLIENGGQALNNYLGTIAATEALEVRSGALNNDAGLLQAGSALTLSATDLTNTNAAGYAALHAGAPGGIVSGGTISMSTGNWNNADGFLGAGGAMSANTGYINNTLGGRIVGQSTVNLTNTGLDNRAGQIQTVGNLQVSANGAVDNRQGLIRGGGALNVYATKIDNRDTGPAGQGIEGLNVYLDTPVLLNAAGAIRADGNVDIESRVSVDNSLGLISAGGDLRINDPGEFFDWYHGQRIRPAALAIINRNGTIIGGEGTRVVAGSMTNDGRLLSLGDLSLDMQGDYTNSSAGEITANGNANLIFSGNFYNTDTLQAGGTLSVSALGIDNAASSTIEAYRTKLSASTLTNRGVIDGVFTDVDAVTLNNIGTGRIYGDYVSIAASTLNNEAEADVGATIAARTRLDIGAGTLNNRSHSLILSGGDMVIGQNLNANRVAYGRANTLNNESAIIEALGNLHIGAVDVNNINAGFDAYYVEGEEKPIGDWSCQAGTGYQCQYDGDAGGGRYPGYWVTSDSNPARISAGGALDIDAVKILNDNSQLMAGGKLSIGTATLNTTGSEAQYAENMAGGGVANQGNLPGAVIVGSVNGNTSGLGGIMAAVAKVVVAKSNAAADVVDAAAGNQAGNAVGTGGPNGSNRNSGAGASGQAGGAAGAQASANGPSGAAGTAGATAAQLAAVSVSNQQANTAVGVNGLNNSDRADSAGQSGSVGTVSATHAANNSGASGTTSTSGTGLQLSGVGVASRVVRAALGADGLDGSDRAGNAGLNGSVLGATGALAATAASANAAGSAAAMARKAVAAVVQDRLADEAVGSGKPNRAALAVAADATDGATAQQASAAAVPVLARVGRIDQVTLSNQSGGAQIVRTTEPDTRIPKASLYSVDAARSSYLIETDARFANYRLWIGSDYMIGQLEMDPAVTQKRLGDGYYEQSLVRAQVAQLTGRRFLGDFTDDDAEYRALMDAGASFAKTWNLRPGMALTAAQMAVLSSDIVWLVEESVALADGSVQKVLVPKVYVRVRDGDIDGSGALLSGKDVDIKVTGNLVNTGTIAGRDVVRLTADNVNNLGGRIHGDGVMVDAKTDLNNIGGTISANKALVITAGRDINIASTTAATSGMAGKTSTSGVAIDRVAGLYVTGEAGTLMASAGRDVNIRAGHIGNAGKDGQTVISGGRNIELGTVTESTSRLAMQNANNYRKETTATEVGSQIVAAGSIALKAGADINLRAATVQAGGALAVQAGNDINIVAGVATSTLEVATQKKKKSFLKSKTTTTLDKAVSTTAIASSLGGATVTLNAGHDLLVQGSAVVGDGTTSLTAGNNLTIAATTETETTSSHSEVKKKGLMSSSGGFGISYGKRTTTTDQLQNAKIQSGQARSIVGSINGDLTITASEALKVSGADLGAGADLTLHAKSVTIDPGLDALTGQFRTKTTQDGLTLAVGGTVVNAIQTAQSMKTLSRQPMDSRVTAMAAATAAMAAASTASDIKANGVGVSVSLTAGHSESEYTQNTTANLNVGSVLNAGKNVNVSAAGAGKDSNVNIVGSEVNAAKNIVIKAENQVNLLAAQDTESQHSDSKSLNAAVGVSASFSSQGPAVGYTASVAASRANSDGEGTTQLNSRLVAKQTVSIASGGDTSIKGALVSGAQVVGDVKGSLNLESLQDTATFDSKSRGIAAGVTAGIGATYNATLNRTHIQADYASVQEKSAIRAGDGGFQLKVGGNTDLKGAVISSSAAGAASSSLDTGTLTSSDISNHSLMKANSIGLSASVTSSGSAGDIAKSGDIRQGGTAANKGTSGVHLMNMGESGTRTSLPGVVAISDNDASTTRSGVGGGVLAIRDNTGQIAATGKSASETGGATNRNVEMGSQTNEAIGNNFDRNGVQTALDVTAVFASTAANAIGNYATEKLKEAIELKVKAAKETNPEEKAQLLQRVAVLETNWSEDGAARVALHTIVGGLAGGSNGALGAGTTALTTPAIAEQIARLDVPKEVKSLLTLAAGATVGATVGGSAGAASSANQVANNFLKHGEAKDMNLALAKCNAKASGCSTAEVESIFNEYRVKSSQNIAELQKRVFNGDAVGAQELLAQAAKPSDVKNVVFSSAQEGLFVSRQYAAVGKSVLTRGYGPYGNDVQAAEKFAQVRTKNCAVPNSSACDAFMRSAVGREQTAALGLVLTALTFGAAEALPAVWSTGLAAKDALLAAPAAIKLAYQSCMAFKMLCIAEVSMFGGEVLSAEALGGTSLAVGVGGSASIKIGSALFSEEAVLAKVGGTVASSASNASAASKTADAASRSTPFTLNLVETVSADGRTLIANNDVAFRAVARTGYEELGLISPPKQNFFSGVNKEFPGVEYIDRTTLRVTDADAYMAALRVEYAKNGEVLHPRTAEAVLARISNPAVELRQGLPGTHGEVRSTNWIHNEIDAINPLVYRPEGLTVVTYRLMPGPGQGLPFVACPNCTSILPPGAYIPTGRLSK